MKIRFEGADCNLNYNENGAMFYLTDSEGEIVEWLSSRRNVPDKPNQTYLDATFLAQMEIKGIVKAVKRLGMLVKGKELEATLKEGVVLCDIVHPEFNDDGYAPFGDFCRTRLGQQCQYGSRYIDGRIEGYPALGEGLRFNNGKPWGKTRELDASDYHAVRIHRDDMDEFERRYKAYCDARVNGKL